MARVKPNARKDGSLYLCVYCRERNHETGQTAQTRLSSIPSATSPARAGHPGALPVLCARRHRHSTVRPDRATPTPSTPCSENNQRSGRSPS